MTIRIEVVDPTMIDIHTLEVTPLGHYYLRLRSEMLVDLTPSGQVEIDWTAKPVTYTHLMFA